MRYVLSGCVVSTVYLLTTSLLSLAVGLPFQAALAIGFAAALSVHFTMQRLFVWTDHDAFALAFRSQMGRYLLVAATQYGLTVASTSLVPPALGLSVELVYVATSLSMASVNFLLYRYHIFHGIS
jgi:putative flippase GtrA